MDIGMQMGQLLTFFMMSVALGMDAFSLSIGIGLNKLTNSEIFKISTTIGVFHIFMPLAGILAGYYLLTYISGIANLIGGGLLVILGIHMFWSAFFGGEEKTLNHTTGLGLLVLAFSVSIDALSVGFSLGLFSANIWLVALLFGVVGAIMTAIGLALGNKIGEFVGDYGEAFGGIILLIFGIKFLV